MRARLPFLSRRATLTGMAEEPENLVLHYLRRLDEKVDQLREDNREIKARLGQVEATVAQVHVSLAEHSLRFDRLHYRLERIERRLDLVDAP
jgi:hypothetical protein